MARGLAWSARERKGSLERLLRAATSRSDLGQCQTRPGDEGERGTRDEEHSEGGWSSSGAELTAWCCEESWGWVTLGQSVRTREDETRRASGR